jgi:hypothetical protein
MDMPFNTWATSVDPDQLAYLCRLIWIYTVRFLVRNNLMDLKANSVDPDQTARMCMLIWIYTGCPWGKSHIPWSIQPQPSFLPHVTQIRS